MIKLKRGMVVLLEGTRNVDKTEKDKLIDFAKDTATKYPDITFRSGNAKGSDELFSKGVELVNPKQMEQILPYKDMNKKRLHPQARILSLDDLTDTEVEELARLTIEATPNYKGLIKAYLQTRTKNKLTVKAMYLLRDALKVTGIERLNFKPASIGFFYVNQKDPEGGGTGHTIRVCKLKNVPVITQKSWLRYL